MLKGYFVASWTKHIQGCYALLKCRIALKLTGIVVQNANFIEFHLIKWNKLNQAQKENILWLLVLISCFDKTFFFYYKVGLY